ncbi:MAG: OsmC family protein [Parvibaculum sp.]|uniref:OsmC family protein n=1 Tax=Parvibaculum sp. TaxID=2024848 RepID=UPI003C7849B9
MAGREHRYDVTVTWAGNLGEGTTGYRAYSRAHEISAPGKPAIPGSAEPKFRGDAARWNPEELLVASISACHKLWYLHLCAVAGVVVTAYSDAAEGIMMEGEGGSGRFTGVTLRPHVTIAAGSDREKALALHHKAHEMCFISNSVNFPVAVEPEAAVEKGDAP